jgi:signal transduction histidine kinase
VRPDVIETLVAKGTALLPCRPARQQGTSLSPNQIPIGASVKRQPCSAVRVQSSGLARVRQYWSRRIAGWRACQYLGSAGFGREGYRAVRITMAGLAPAAASRMPVAAVGRFTAAVSPVSPGATTSVALWWLAGARAVITAVVACAAGVLIVVTVATRRRLIRAARIRSVLSLGGPLTGSSLRDALRRLTGDPGLEVYCRLPGRAEYVTAAGEPVPWHSGARPGPSRQLIGAGTVDEQGFTALVETTASADRAASTLRQTVLEAAVPALENARLQATLRRQVLDLVSARSQTVRAFLAERRRLEGQLHDGTQACLYEARSQVRRARPHVSHPAAAASIDAAAVTLGDAITELGTLVRGIYPAGLRETGLGSALFTATSDFPLVVEIADDADNSLDEVTATAGFFTVMDVLQIAARSGARAATVRISGHQDRAHLRIAYTPRASSGSPGAGRAGPGTDETDAWLAAEDRVRAMDGTMQVTSASPAVIVEVELPCAS